MHISVLSRQVVDLLAIKPGGIYWDVTGGAGGHAGLILEKLNKGGRFIVSDCDADAVTHLRKHFGGDPRCHIFQARFSEVLKVFRSEKTPLLSGLIADLGFSSMQMEDALRGLSFQRVGPLDMRLDPRLEQTAGDLIENLPEKELADLIFRWGEERHARLLARAIVAERKKRTITSTQDLSELASRILGPFYRGAKIHPATRLFQALRIAVNRELEELEALLFIIPEIMALEGRVAMISFHSLEDRMVKQSFQQLKKQGWKWITKKPMTPSAEEMGQNPRSRSAKLRVIEKG